MVWFLGLRGMKAIAPRCKDQSQANFLTVPKKDTALTSFRREPRLACNRLNI